MGKRKRVPAPNYSLFVRRVEELCKAELLRRGAWRLSGNADPSTGNFPSRDQLIAFLTFFRQFFLHTKEPVSVGIVAASLKQEIKDQELLDPLTFFEKCDPFELDMKLEIGGRKFDLRQLTEAFISKYFHSDRIPTEIADDGYSWQVHLFLLSFAFARGMKIVLALRAIILEADRRGLIEIAPASGHRI
jgi:hypothetical protein